MLQGSYRANNLVGIEEYLAKLSQETAEDRTEVTDLTGANMNLPMKVLEYTNHMATKGSSMATIQKTINQIHGEIKTLKRKLLGHPTKKQEATSHRKGNW